MKINELIYDAVHDSMTKETNERVAALTAKCKRYKSCVDCPRLRFRITDNKELQAFCKSGGHVSFDRIDEEGRN